MKWRRKPQPSNLVNHAERELALSGLVDPNEPYDVMLADAVMAHVRLFAAQGHSGMSAPITVSLLEKLLRFEPLGPLTGDDSEWVPLDYAPDLAAQNKRCGRVFRRADGTAYDTEGRVFEDTDGSRWTNIDSRVEVTFPYVPSTEVVMRNE